MDLREWHNPLISLSFWGCEFVSHTLRQASMFLSDAEHVQRLAPLRATVRQPPRGSPRNAGAMTAFLKKSSFSIGRASA
jgi:hypothetical protein